MTFASLAAYGGVVIDAGLVVLLVAILARLGRDDGRDLSATEARLRELHDGLRLLVAQAQGEARDLDRRLAEFAERHTAPPSPEPAPTEAKATAAPPRRPSLAEEAARLAAAQTPLPEIARRLSLPVAEARVLAGLRRPAPASRAAS